MMVRRVRADAIGITFNGIEHIISDTLACHLVVDLSKVIWRKADWIAAQAPRHTVQLDGRGDAAPRNPEDEA